MFKWMNNWIVLVMYGERRSSMVTCSTISSYLASAPWATC